jgi:hypothetical protein
MLEAANTSETFVNFYQTTRRYNPEDSHLKEMGFGLDEIGTGYDGKVHRQALVNTVMNLRVP